MGTRLMKRVERAPKGVKGISLKLQEEQREKRLDFVPEHSALDTGTFKVDIHTRNMLKAMNMGNISGLKVERDETKKRMNKGKRYGRDGKLNRNEHETSIHLSTNDHVHDSNEMCKIMLHP